MIYVKSVYSFLSSTITIDDMISMALNNHLDTLYLCDDNMYGAMEFITKSSSNNIRPVIGLDIDGILLYAKNYFGYKNLLHLSKIKQEREVTPDDLIKYHDNLICFTNIDNKFKDIFKDTYYYSNKKDNKYLYVPKILCLNKDDFETLKYLHMLRDNKTLSDNYEIDEDVFYQENESLNKIFKDVNIILPKYELNLPNYCDYNDTKGLNSDEYLYNLSIAGLNKRLNNKVPFNYKERLLYELDIIKKMGFSNYFLIVYDYIKYAKNNNILVGPGRGSASGSLVSFSLGITEIDPIKYNLLFERFLNVERVTMPDIDTDFPFDRRDDVINYCISKYGKDKVAGIITFNTFGSKLALRDMGRVLNVPDYMVNELCKKVDNDLKSSHNKEEIKILLKSDNKLKKLYNICMKIEGFPKNSSSHASGIIISNTSLEEIVPLVNNDDKYLCGYENKYLEHLGLLKMDFLGIKNLTIIDNTLNLIKEKYNEIVKFNDIPLDDVDTFKIFQQGDTNGIFQFESEGMKNFLIKLHPNSFEQIYNANAFYRPGPSNNIDLFIKRCHGDKIEYFDERLKNILESTKGIIVYQEQIMQIANVMANFTLGEADILRRAISKKNINDIKKMQEKFFINAQKNNYSKNIIEKIFNYILNFADYGLNKSHSVAYSVISYKMAYLKYHYPLCFYVSILNNTKGDDEKIISYIKEIKRKNIKICKPDINKSSENFNIYYQSIYLPLTIIKGISNVIANKIISKRGQVFLDIYDFFNKVGDILNRKILESLINSGALDIFNYNRCTLYENIDSLLNYANLVKELGDEYVLKPEIIEHSEYSKEELIEREKNCFGFYLSNHPTNFYKNNNKNIVNLIDINKYFNKWISVIGMIDKIREIETKKGDKMAFISISDEDADIEIVCFPKVYSILSNIKKGDIIIVKGKVEKERSFHIIASEILNVKEIV